MSESKAIVSWSSLNTVSELDMGLSDNGRDIIRTNEDISKTIVKSLFIESLIDQLCKLLEKDPVKRHNLYEGICSKLHEMQLIEDTYHIEELASLRGYYQQALLDLMVAPDTRLCSMPCIKLGSSRYATEYEELCFIASGGFGKVYKAKNRLDQVVYAVKKISLKYQNVTTFAKKLNEVKTLAKLNHLNIVQYKAAWLEPLLTLTPPIQSPDSNLSSSDSDIVVFQSNHSNSESNNQCLTQEENESDKNVAVCKYRNGNGAVQRPIPQVSAFLYVTMQLCDETLHEWLYNRNLHKEPVDIPLVVYIMTQAASGVQYIHSCNIVHHDIKPRNIFLSKDLKSVQVGDFGLCCLQEHNHSDCSLEEGQFGTPLYAAPEKLKGHCHPKSDMFSLGLVFIELLTVFSTEMERVKVLTKSRSGQLPPSIPEVLLPTITSLISHKMHKRPTADELVVTLKNLKGAGFDETETKMSTKSEDGGNGEAKTDADNSTRSVAEERDQLLKDKDKEILQLRQMLAQRENEIAELKNLIDKDSEYTKCTNHVIL